MAIISLLILFVFALLLIGGIVLLVMGVMRLRRGGGGAAEGGACGQCGYSVNQLESMTCPECGADLRTVGIKTRGGKGGGVAMVVTGALLLVLGLGCVGSMTFAVFNARRAAHNLHQQQRAVPVPVQPAPTNPLSPNPTPAPAPAPAP